MADFVAGLSTAGWSENKVISDRAWDMVEDCLRGLAEELQNVRNCKFVKLTLSQGLAQQEGA